VPRAQRDERYLDHHREAMRTSPELEASSPGLSIHDGHTLIPRSTEGTTTTPSRASFIALATDGMEPGESN